MDGRLRQWRFPILRALPVPQLHPPMESTFTLLAVRGVGGPKLTERDGNRSQACLNSIT